MSPPAAVAAAAGKGNQVEKKGDSLPNWERMNLLVAQVKGLLVEAKVAEIQADQWLSWLQGLLFAQRELKGRSRANALIRGYYQTAAGAS